MTGVEPISTVTMRTVKAGQEGAFEQSLKDFFECTRSAPGQLAIHVVRPMPGSGSRDWGILRTFESQKAKDDFFSSPEFAEWQAVAAPFMEGERVHEALTGLETWFTLPGSKAIVPPPRWKMALMSALGSGLSVSLLGISIGPYLAGVPPLGKTVLNSLMMAVLMTYLMMPNITRLFKTWLYPKKSK